MSTVKSKITKEEIFEKVRAIIVDKFCVSGGEVTLEAKFIDNLGADSLDIVEFSIIIENEFGFRFEDSELETLVKVQDLITLIDEKIN